MVKVGQIWKILERDFFKSQLGEDYLIVITKVLKDSKDAEFFYLDGYEFTDTVGIDWLIKNGRLESDIA